MRSTFHAPGSADAQADLASLAGWAPRRRGFLSSLLVAGAAAAAAGTAAAIIVPASAADTPAGSSRIADLIAEYARLSAALDVAEAVGDLEAWDRAADARRPALEALISERPQSLIDLAAKLTALADFMRDEDAENYAFQRLAEDATLLAGAAE
jgi:hypothetical protein